jgi:hypothetical protein
MGHYRNSLIAFAMGAAVLAASPAMAASASSTGPDKNASATIRVLRPLTLKWVQDLDLGTVALGQGAFSTNVGIAKDGTWTCDTTKVTCTGTHQVARYNVAGTNNRTVTISAGNVTMTSGANSLLLTVDSPLTVDLGASGTSGVNFSLGGSVPLSNTTPDGLYVGTFNVTADYQ